MIGKLLGTLLFLGVVLIPSYPSSHAVGILKKPQTDVTLIHTRMLLEERYETYKNNMVDYSSRLDTIIKLLNKKSHGKKDHLGRGKEKGIQQLDKPCIPASERFIDSTNNYP